MRSETFTTHITFTSGDSHKEAPITSDKLSSTITRLLRGPAAMMGIIDEVRIVDGWDCIVFHAVKGKILFPKQPKNNSQK